MEISDFKAKLKRTEDDQNIYLDFRPFGDEQTVAIDFYLHESLETIRNRGVMFRAKPIVILCDWSAEIPLSGFRPLP